MPSEATLQPGGRSSRGGKSSTSSGGTVASVDMNVNLRTDRSDRDYPTAGQRLQPTPTPPTLEPSALTPPTWQPSALTPPTLEPSVPIRPTQAADVLQEELNQLRRQQLYAAQPRRPSTATTVPLATAAAFLYPQHLQRESLLPTGRSSRHSSNRSQRTSTTISGGQQPVVSHAVTQPTFDPSAGRLAAAPMSVGPSVRSCRSGRSNVSNRSVLVSAEVFSVVHRVTDALLQVTHQSRDDAIARERLLLQQQQLIQRDFIEKEIKEKQISAERESKERQLLAQEKQMLLEKEIKEKQMQLERENKDKQILADKEKMQLEREIKAAEAIEKDKLFAAEMDYKQKQLMVEKELKERELQLSEKQKLIEFVEKEQDKIKLEFEAKLELSLQLAEEKKKNALLEAELNNTKQSMTQANELICGGSKEPALPLLVDVGDILGDVADAGTPQASPVGDDCRLFTQPLTTSNGSTTPVATPVPPSLFTGDRLRQDNTLVTSCVSQITSHLLPAPTSTLTTTQTLTTEPTLATPLILWPTQTDLLPAELPKLTDTHHQQANLPTTVRSSEVSMNSTLPPQNSLAETSLVQSRDPVVGPVTTNESQPLTSKDSGRQSNPGQPIAPMVSNVTLENAPKRTTDCVKLEQSDRVQSPNPPQEPTITKAQTSTGLEIPSAPLSAQSPVVIVRQLQTPKPYSGQTSYKSFREHFERVAKANAWSTESEKMQHLALALEGPALECLREVKEDEIGAYDKIWCVLARRFGHLDEPDRAMRRFDARKQLEGESVAEYEQALRTLYREAWPKVDEDTKDCALKRKFEEGLSSADMVQFLRLHARQDDFVQTVAKARRFAEAQEAARPQKSVRIIEAKDRDHSAEGTHSVQPNLQPLIDGFERVIQTVIDRSQISAVTSVEARDETLAKPGTGKYPVAPRVERSARQDRSTQQSGKSGRVWKPGANGSSNSDRSRDNTPDRESRPSYGRDGPPGHWRGRGNDSRSPGRGESRSYGQRPGPPGGQPRNHYRSNSADSFYSNGRRQRPRYDDDERTRRTDQVRSYHQQGTPEQGRPYYGQRPYRSTGYDKAGINPPPPREDRGHCSVCGDPGCHSDLHRGIRRNHGAGCHVCGVWKCHSMFHERREWRPQNKGPPPQAAPNQENHPRGPRQGDRPPPIRTARCPSALRRS